MTGTSHRVDAVTFDYWNTLAWEAPGQLVERRLVAWAGLLEEAGLEALPSRLATAHELAFAEYQAAWRANRQYVVADATDRMIAALAMDIGPELRRALVESFAAAGDMTEIHASEGVHECLRTLSSSGVKLGIVCDVGLTPSPSLLRHLERWGLLDLFEGWAFSDEIGVYKPDAALYRVALSQLGVAAERAAHVGDRLRTDVAGARTVGMVSVRYTGVYDDREPGMQEADHVIRDLRELPAVLGVAPSATS